MGIEKEDRTGQDEERQGNLGLERYTRREAGMRE
jgi:hypothetical protein